jgi:hypothetical protein
MALHLLRVVLRNVSNPYFCHQCKAIRPFSAPGATMMRCESCTQWNIGIASYCEWCGVGF